MTHLLCVQPSLHRFVEVEDRLTLLVSQLSGKGGCPVAYAVAKHIQAAADEAPRQRPYHWRTY
jgi:hypothetical protein